MPVASSAFTLLCVFTSRSERFPHQALIILAPTPAALASHEHNSRQQKKSKVAARTGGCCGQSTACVATAGNRRLSKDEHSSCQLSFYPTLVSSPHVQRDSHIKL